MATGVATSLGEVKSVLKPVKLRMRLTHTLISYPGH